MPETRHSCPRRMQEMGPWQRADWQDTWRAGPVGPVCSFCGSLDPDRFLELVRQGWLVVPTDKNYKVYLEKPLTDQEREDRRANWLAGNAVAEAIRELGERDGKTPDQIQSDLDAAWAKQAPGWLHSATVAKFYYRHLLPDQRDEFIELHNNGRMQIGYPGHLYVLPLFAKQGR